MPQRDAAADPSVVKLARAAMARGHAALAADDLEAALGWLERAHRLVPRDANVMLSLASACLGQDPMRAVILFGGVAEKYDVRQAWFGLAAAYLRMNRPVDARGPLANALARHALVSDIVALADQIAGALGGPGWCGLTSGGKVEVHVATPAATRVSLDGKLLRGTTLPPGWANKRRVEVLIGGRPALGSPIQLDAIRRTVGCVEACDGGIRGWAWHPADPDTPVALTLVYPASRHKQAVQAVQAVGKTIAVPDTGPLARPRAFILAGGDLIDAGGPVHVRGPDGKDLLGSPLEPAADKAALHDAARLLGHWYPARSPATGSRSANCVTTFLPAPSRLSPSRPVLAPSLPYGSSLRADAPVPAEPTGAESRKRAAAVVIPVHDGAVATSACLASVLASASADLRIIVVDDGSSDTALIAMLDDLARRHKVILVRHPRALGFPASANAGILAASGQDVVLLNSDTLVPSAVPSQVASRVSSAVTSGWLDRLRDAAYYSARDIGTVTPFSNDAAILSYPGDAGTNPCPDQTDTDRLDRLAWRANGGTVVDIPVGVGFCLYVRRDCLNVVGLFRADVFAQGYGEENDFCLRARRLGWRNVALTGLCVSHHGGSSFGADAGHLRARNSRLVEQLHPGYNKLIAEFLVRDPVADARRRIDLLRWRLHGRGWRQAAILITHNDGGGVERRVALAARAHAAAGRRPIVLRPAEGAGGALAIAVHEGTAGDFPNLLYHMPQELPALLRLLRRARLESVEVHHFLDHPQQAVHDLVIRLGVPYDVHVHDYAWFCPRVSLVGKHDRYCGEPDLLDCEACVADLGHFLKEDTTVAALRVRSGAFLAAARHVVTPSDDAGARMRRHFPDLSPTTVPHEDDTAIMPVGTPAPATGRLRVCIVGGIGVHKGYDVLLACARDAVRRNLPLEFVVVGATIDDERLLETGRIFVTGEYQPDEAVGLIIAQRARLGFVPSIWPETWCLSLGDIWRAGLPAAAFDIGAPAERIRRTGRGFLLPLGLSTSAINNALAAAAGTTRRA